MVEAICFLIRSVARIYCGELGDVRQRRYVEPGPLQSILLVPFRIGDSLASRINSLKIFPPNHALGIPRAES